MPRNGSGGYTPPSNSFNPALNGVAATATDWNATLSDLATAIQQSVSADGQTPITGNLQMGGNKLTGLGAGSGTGQSLRFEQLFSQGTLTDIASAATTDIGAQLTTLLRVTGTTGITSFGTNYNGPRFLIFQGIVTLTHSATLVLPGAANITTAANDALVAVPISGGWQVVAYQKADGSALSAPLIAATTAGTSTAYTITPTPAISAYAANQTYWVTFHTASGAAPTLQISGVATPPSLVRQDATGAYVNIAALDIPANHRSRVTLISATQALVEELPPLVLRSYLSGYTMSTAGSSATMTVAAGSAADSTNVVFINLNSSISKTTSSWAVGTGNGGLDTGAIANNTWYHFHAIRRPDTGVVDVLVSLSPTAPTLPANYTQFRRIGSGRTNGSAQWLKFVQDGDYFRWDASILDVGLLNPGTTAVSATLSVPSGVNVEASINVVLSDSTNLGSGAYISDLATPDEAPSASVAPLLSTSQIATTNIAVAANLRVRTNTSAQVRYRVNTSFATLAFRIATLGWYDSRGRNA